MKSFIWNMSPTGAVDDSLNAPSSQTEQFGQFGVTEISSFVKPSDFFDLLCGDFTLPVFFAAIACSVLTSIQLVLLMGVPSQISWTIVCSIPVVVAALHSFWAWTKKCFCHYPMHISPDILVVSPKVNSGVRFLFDFEYDPFAKKSPSIGMQNKPIQGTHTSQIGDFIHFFKTNYRFPNFGHGVSPFLNHCKQCNSGQGEKS